MKTHKGIMEHFFTHTHKNVIKRPCSRTKQGIIRLMRTVDVVIDRALKNTGDWRPECQLTRLVGTAWGEGY